MITQIVTFDVKPEHADSFRQALVENRGGAAQEAGCLEMRLFVDNKQPNLFIGYTRWEDQDALDRHANEPHNRQLAEMAETMVQSPMETLRLGETVPAPLYEKNPKSANPEDDVFIIFFIFKIRDGFRERLLAQFEKHVAHTRQEEGCLLFDLYSVDGADDTLAVYERWRKESDVWDVHFKQPYSVETGALMHEAVVGDMEQYMNFVTEIV